MTSVEELLASAFTLDNLQVYGDHLLQLGDPRGELVAIDVHGAREGTTKELAHRRRQALRKWLKLAPSEDPTRGVWSSARFAFGFVEDVQVDAAARVLASPAGPFVRALTLTGKTAGIEHVLVEDSLAHRDHGYRG